MLAMASVSDGRRNVQRPCPDDFQEVFVEIGRLACEEHYHVGRRTVNLWLEQYGKGRLLASRQTRMADQMAQWPQFQQRKCPVDFAIAFPVLGIVGCIHRYQAHRRTISRWLDECGREKLIAARQRETQPRDTVKQINRRDIGMVLSRAFPLDLSAGFDSDLG